MRPHLVIARAIIEALRSLDLSFPKPSKEQRQGLKEARRQLEEQRP